MSMHHTLRSRCRGPPQFPGSTEGRQRLTTDEALYEAFADMFPSGKRRQAKTSTVAVVDYGGRKIRVRGADYVA